MSSGFEMSNVTYCPEIVQWFTKSVWYAPSRCIQGAQASVCRGEGNTRTQHGRSTVTCKSENSYGGTSSCIQDIAPCPQHSLSSSRHQQLHSLHHETQTLSSFTIQSSGIKILSSGYGQLLEHIQGKPHPLIKRKSNVSANPDRSGLYCIVHILEFCPRL